MTNNHQHRATERGFTLFEVIITIAVAAILSAIATPVMLPLLADMRLNSAARDLYSTINRARAESAKRNVDCTLVFNQPIGGSVSSYVLFQDSNTALGRNSDYDAGETILVNRTSWPASVSIGAAGITFNLNDDGYPAVTFKPTSMPFNNAGAVIGGSVTLTNTNGRIKTVTVGTTGSVSIN